MSFVSTSSRGSGSGGALAVLSSGVFGVNTATIDITNIPQTYESLRLIVFGRSTRAANNLDDTFLQFNGDAGNNYQWIRTGITPGSTTSVGEQSAGATLWITPSYLPAATSVAGQMAAIEILIPGYASSTLQKSVSSMAFTTGAAQSTLMVGGGLWLSTAAITRLVFGVQNASSWVAGTRFRLYGMA